MGVKEAEGDQPHGAAIVDVGGLDACAAGFGAGGEDERAGAEQHGEDGSHLAVEEGHVDEPGGEVDAGGSAVGRGVHVGGRGEREGVDIEQEYAEEGEASEDVDGFDAVGGTDRGNVDVILRHDSGTLTYAKSTNVMRRGIAGLAAVMAVAGGVYLWRLTAEIERQARVDEARAADVIVVLGAAEYRGKPSPVLKARLDHALELWRRKMAPRILTTGGAGGDPLWTESEVGRSYLSKRGVPVEAIVIEPEGESTVESTTAASEIMRRMNLRSCIVVSDGYHIYRAKKLMENQGFVVYGSPRRSERPVTGWAQHWLSFRQAVGLGLWRVGIRI